MANGIVRRVETHRASTTAMSAPAADPPSSDVKHCVRCHASYESVDDSPCVIFGGRDTQVKMKGTRAGFVTVDVCMQCEREHDDADPSGAFTCFLGRHTERWDDRRGDHGHISDESDPLDFPAPQAEKCEACGGEAWGANAIGLSPADSRELMKRVEAKEVQAAR